MWKDITNILTTAVRFQRTRMFICQKIVLLCSHKERGYSRRKVIFEWQHSTNLFSIYVLKILFHATFLFVFIQSLIINFSLSCYLKYPKLEPTHAGKTLLFMTCGCCVLWIKGWEWEKVCKQLVGFYLYVQISSDSAPELSLNYPIGVIHKA